MLDLDNAKFRVREEKTVEIYKIYKYRWVILAVYMYVQAINQVYCLNFAAVATYIQEHMNIPAMQIGSLVMVYNFVMVLLAIPVGLLVDRRGFKYCLGIGALFSGVFAMLRLVNPESYIVLLICQIGIGIGQPFIVLGVTKLAVTWFPQKEEATAVGLGTMALFLGMMVALGATPILVEAVGFRSMVLIYGILGIAGPILVYGLVKAKPEIPPGKIEVVEQVSNWEGIKRILKIRNFVILGFIILIGAGLFIGLSSWLEMILSELHQISMVDAGTIGAVLMLSAIIGCILIPILSDKIMRRKPFVLLASVVGVVCAIVSILANGFALNMINIIILGLLLVSVNPILFTMATEIVGARFAGISIGYLQLLAQIGGIIFVFLVEALHGATGSYIVPLASLAVLMGVGFVLATQLKETARKQEVTTTDSSA